MRPQSLVSSLAISSLSISSHAIMSLLITLSRGHSCRAQRHAFSTSFASAGRRVSNACTHPQGPKIHVFGSGIRKEKAAAFRVLLCARRTYAIQTLVHVSCGALHMHACASAAATSGKRWQVLANATTHNRSTCRRREQIDHEPA
jgi:hypothetical protein